MVAFGFKETDNYLMDIRIEQARLEQKPIIKKLLGPYLEELHKFDEEVHSKVSDYKYLDLYWAELGRVPYLIYVDGKLAGFVLVNEHSILKENKNAKSIAEFFILPEYRKKGIGEKVAFSIFDKYSGKWEVTAMKNNLIAIKFWNKVIINYTEGNFNQVNLDNDKHKGPIYSFSR